MSDASTSDLAIVRFFTEVGIIDQLAQSALERRLPDGMRSAHFTMLHHLARLGGEWSPARLASALQVTKGAVTNTVGKLEAKGYLAVRPDPEDGRGKLVSLTEEGRAARDSSLLGVAPLFAELLEAVPENDFAAALPFLERVRRLLDERRY